MRFTLTLYAFLASARLSLENLWILTTVISNLPFFVLGSHTILYQLGKVFFTLNRIDFQSPASKLFLSLFQKVDTVYNKEKLRNNALLRIIIGQIFDIEIRQRSLSATLRMSNNTLLLPFIKVAFNRFCGEHLRIAHNMLL